MVRKCMLLLAFLLFGMAACWWAWPSQVRSLVMQALASVGWHGRDGKDAISKAKPIHLFLAVDTSGRWQDNDAASFLRVALRRFVREKLTSKDLISIVLVSDRSDWLVREYALERGTQALEDEVAKITFSGGRSLWDGLAMIGRDISRTRDAGLRPALLIVVNGKDTTSRENSLEDVLRSVAASKVPIFMVGCDVRDSARKELDAIAQASGGKYYDSTLDSLIEVVSRAATEMRER